jgi:hypothetical protein
MSEGFAELHEALVTVQRVLDRLTEMGKNEAAFSIAQAQFAATLRTSFPANLGALARAIDDALAKGDLGLTGEELGALRRAADVLKTSEHP